MDDITFTGWRKPRRSFSNGNCAEAGTWRKSSYSTYNGNCPEAGSCPHGVAVRDTKHREGPALLFAADTWRKFLAAVKAAPVPSSERADVPDGRATR